MTEDRKITPEDVCETLRNHEIPFLDGQISSFVYFITDGEYVKIGKGFPLPRMKMLQTGNPRELKLLFSIPIGPHSARNAEYQIHELFKRYWMRGEWFDILNVIDVDEFVNRFGRRSEVVPMKTEPEAINW